MEETNTAPILFSQLDSYEFLTSVCQTLTGLIFDSVFKLHFDFLFPLPGDYYLWSHYESLPVINPYNV